MSPPIKRKIVRVVFSRPYSETEAVIKSRRINALAGLESINISTFYHGHYKKSMLKFM